MQKAIILYSLLILTGKICPVDLETKILELKKQSYGFSPCKLSEQQKEGIGVKLDEFAKLVDDNKPESLVILRKLLQNEKNDKYFLVDASALLASKSAEPNDLKVILSALEHGDPCGTNKQFFGLANYLSLKGLDVYPLVEKILLEPKFSYFMSDHFLSIGKRESAVLLLFRQESGTFIEKLKVFLLANQKNQELSIVVAEIMFLAGSADADKFLVDFANSIKDVKYKEQVLSRIKQEKIDEKLTIASKTLSRKDLEKHLESFIMRRYKELPGDPEAFKKDAAILIQRENIPYLNGAIMKTAKRVSDEGLNEMYYLVALRRVAMSR